MSADLEEVDLFAPDRHIYRCYGGGSALFRWLKKPEEMPEEVLLCGPAGTGKTRQVCEFAVSVCGEYPESKILMVRKTRASMNESILACLEDHVLGPDHPAVQGATRAHREKYSHPSLGGEIVLGGLDNEKKIFSTEYNLVIINEAVELTLSDWESLHRALRRPMGFPAYAIVADTNPASPGHFLRKRSQSGITHLIESRLSDNPIFYDHARKEWTPRGLKYAHKMGHNMSGVRRKRLFLGLWAGSEGMVWENYNADIHLITARLEQEDATGAWQLHIQGREDPVHLKWFCGGQDVGHTAAGVAHVFGFDSDGRAYRVAEVMHTGKDHEWWAGQWVTLTEKFGLRAIACDHDKALISALNRRLGEKGMSMIARPAWKHRGAGSEKAGIDVVRVGFKVKEDGLPSIFIVRDSRIHPADPALVENGYPTTWDEEIEGFVYPPDDGEKPNRDIPDPRCKKDACDSARYALSWAWQKDLTPKPQDVVYKPGTYGHLGGTPATLEAENRKKMRRDRRFRR